jgi:hypothetical protein
VGGQAVCLRRDSVEKASRLNAPQRARLVYGFIASRELKLRPTPASADRMVYFVLEESGSRRSPLGWRTPRSVLMAARHQTKRIIAARTELRSARCL